jgi:hypothetical protein
MRSLNPMAVEASQAGVETVTEVLQPPLVSIAAILPAAVDKEPFSPNRTRPPVRYRLPGEIDETAAPGSSARRPPIRWVGVVVSEDSVGLSLFAALGTNQNAPWEALTVGDKIGAYTLKSFDYWSATFVTDGGEPVIVNNPRKGQ